MKIHLITIGILLPIFCSCQRELDEYVCKPCNLPCDRILFHKVEICPHCSMQLIKKSELDKEKQLILNDIQIEVGSSAFFVDGGQNKKEKQIKIYYHRPLNYVDSSNILIVIPGAGRNGDSYRDTWIETAEKHSILILSLMYPE